MQSVLREYWGGLVVIFQTKKPHELAPLKYSHIFQPKGCNAGIKMSTGNDSCLVAGGVGKRKRRVRQESCCYLALKRRKTFFIIGSNFGLLLLV